MMHDVPSLAQLIKALQQVPYVASKNIYRVADYFLQAVPLVMSIQTQRFCFFFCNFHSPYIFNIT